MRLFKTKIKRSETIYLIYTIFLLLRFLFLQLLFLFLSFLNLFFIIRTLYIFESFKFSYTSIAFANTSSIKFYILTLLLFFALKVCIEYSSVI